MNNTFYFSYAGNKRNEIKNFTELIDIDLYDKFIEPFGGTLAFSRYIYKLNPNKKFYVSDINKELIYFCNNFYKDNENILNKTKEIVNNIKNKEEFNNYYNKKTTINDDDFLTYYLFKKTYFAFLNEADLN